ncbi:hypothetical protein CC1G_01958 [Coprinopsis cinerea okayama7|uniref:Calcineurin-like phosphoesterase domain-containing protein n=1 Tax=Coprinopsis cinerea (strain Okayama-7 / 130 / ATCC MYA-4618 / FGSC 9003) TaxID=240176 RepID=A8N637_COPC7|nr:hypothetical protein CC1G_01958 [Coprinopsis cinerea okayama7\|eukprot:XP_001830322.2 hypothetical protein CC1G_01958 [Coprinopsis cinerea okayama7\
MAKSNAVLTNRSAGQSHLYSPAVRKNVFRILGIIVVIWGEIGAFYWTLRGCRWPTPKGAKGDNRKRPTHVLLLSDTQVKHPLLQSRGEAWSSVIRRFFYDLNLKKSWHVTTRLKPDVVIFLGDMLSNGKQAKNAESYSKAVKKFKKIFKTDAGVATYYVPGNNDITMGEITPVAKRVRGYFTESFGPLSQAFDVNNHTLVILNAPGLVDEDYQRAGRGVSFAKWTPIPDGPIAFVNDIASKIDAEDGEKEGKSQKPVILLSHIPLARPEMANCGPLREKGTIRRDVGHGYQSMLGRQTTTFLLKTGDNRDYCEYSHTNPDDAHSIREVTLKSFSMSVHIQRPGFQLLSIMDPSDSSTPLANPNPNTIADTPCFLPNQSKIYTSFYTPLFILTVLALFLLNYTARRKGRGRYRYNSLPPIRIGAGDSGSTSSSGRSSPVHLRAPSNTLVWATTPTWSPYSPNTPLSPRPGNNVGLPGVLRTPHSASGFNSTGPPTFRASSRPGTPTLGGSLVVPESPFRGVSVDEEDEDPMQPSQYSNSILRRESAQRRYHDDHDEEWSDVGGMGRSASTSSMALKEEEDYDMVNNETSDDQQAPFLPAPSSHSKHKRKFSEFISAPYIKGVKRGSTSERGWSWSFELAGRRRRISLRPPDIAGLRNLVSLFEGPGLHRKRQSLLAVTVVDYLSVSWPGVLTWCFIAWCLS